MACFGPKPSLIHLFPRLPRECGWPVLALSCCHFSMLVCNASARFRFLHCLCSHCRPSLDVFCNISGKINTLGLSALIHLAKTFLQPFTPSSACITAWHEAVWPQYGQPLAGEGMFTVGFAGGSTPREKGKSLKRGKMGKSYHPRGYCSYQR